LYPDTVGVVGWNYRKTKGSTLLLMDGDIERKISIFLGIIRLLI
jgi:hypothetical protein